MYVDPNSGGMLFQALLVMFGVLSAAILIFSGRIRLYIAKLRRQIRDRNNPESQEAISDIESPPPAA